MKRLFLILAVTSFLLTTAVRAQQLPNSDCEDWSASTFDGAAQPKSWYFSNVTQFGLKFNFAHREAGHTGNYSMMCQDQEIGAAGITETSPGYVSLGQPWVYIESLTKVSQATAGDAGGISWTYRPDTMQVWIRRTGNNTHRENFHLLFYSWKGTAKGTSYKGKNGNCTSTTRNDEESDIRLSTNGNECGTAVKAQQVAEGWYKEMNKYEQWTLIKVPIFYMSNDVPEKCNVIFSASNYPNFRANSGLYAGNSLYVDDIKLIYSSKIEKLYIDGIAWNGFNPNTEEEQVYALGENATTVPDIYAMRGSGSLTNSKGQTATFVGRRLQGSEIEIKKGAVGEVTTIIVHAEDGSSTTTYRIRFTKAASSNTRIAGLWLKQTATDSTAVSNFNPYSETCEVELPYGTTTPPLISVTPAEQAQRIEITQARTLRDRATVRVTAADGTHTRTYTVSFRVALLTDNSLADILVNGVSVSGFTPTQTIYRVSLPLGTTAVPTVKAVSKYPDGEQTITYKAPETVDGGVYQISVTTPGNSTPRVYKLNFRIEASSYTYLKDLKVGNDLLLNFEPEVLTYYVSLPMGTQTLPEVKYEQGDPYQTVTMTESGVNGTMLITVTAANGAQSVYKIYFSTPQSSNAYLEKIFIGGVELEGFRPEQRIYTVSLPVGTIALPAITWVQGDEYQTVTLAEGGVTGTTRLTVTAGDGSVNVYQLQVSVQQATNCSLRMIYIDGVELDGFNPDITDYTFTLTQGTAELPEVGYDAGDDFQKVTVRKPAGLTGDYRLTVRAENGTVKTYTIRFLMLQSSNTALQTIRIDGVEIPDFEADKTEYTVVLQTSKLPEVEPVKGDATQRLLSVRDGNKQVITVTAEDNSQRTYTVNFVIQKSESAFLKMIYVDGKPLENFQKEQLTYTCLMQTATCPRLTVDKEEGQRVTITTPYGAGEAQIRVEAETGEYNLYIITFTAAPSGNVQLLDILLDGVSMEGFSPLQQEYTFTAENTLPQVTPVSQDGQQTEVLWKDTVATVYVVNGEATAVYTLRFTKLVSSDCSLSAILCDDVIISGFAPDVTEYTVSLPAGAVLPAVTFTLAEQGQTAWTGSKQRNQTQIIVQAPDGKTRQTYTVAFDIALFDDATLKDMSAEGVSLSFQPTTFDYEVEIESGRQLPTLTLTTREQQTAVVSTQTADRQQVLVTAQSGRTATYTITYHRTLSQNALLQDILLDGKSLTGFNPEMFQYTDSLPTDAESVPSIHPMGQTTNQTITTYHCQAGNTARIHVVAADGKTESDYYISFPKRRTQQATLRYVEIDEALDFTFRKEQTDYLITLPQGTTSAPQIYYTRADESQAVEYTQAPLNGTSMLKVTAADGSQLTYTFRYQVEQSSADNRLQQLSFNGIVLDVNEDNHTVSLPYGTVEADVQYTKAFAEQTVYMVAGGVSHPTRVFVRSNRANEPERIYTITPQVVKHNPAVLAAIKVNGTDIDNFDPMVHNYVVNVTDVPDIQAVAADGAEVTTSRSLDRKSKTVQFTVKSGDYSNVYTVSYYFTNCTPPFDFTGDWVKAARGNGYKPTSQWKVPADYSTGYTWNIPIVNVPLTYSTGKEVTQSGNGVLLSTQRGSSLNGSVPGMMTLGTMSLSLTSNGNSSSSVTQNASTGVTFRNTPEQFAVRVKPLSTTNISNWKIWLTMSDGSNYKTSSYIGAFSSLNSWRDVVIDINYPQNAVTKFNILLNSGDQENAGSYGGNTVYESDVQMENLRFIYNSRIASLTVDGEQAQINGTDITFNVADPEYSKFPEVLVKGEVEDQMQAFTWHDEVQGKRTALIRNFGEDGSYTDYTLSIVRPLSQENRLHSIIIDGMLLEGFAADNTDYTCYLPCGTAIMPDMQVVPMSVHAQTTVAYSDSKALITVTSETGEAKQYTISFVEQRSADTRLAMINATGVSFSPDTREYHLQGTRLPDIRFTKLSDGQTVTLNNGVLTVVAEDGIAKGEYKVLIDYVTSGQLSEWQIDGQQPAEFRTDVYDYSFQRPGYTAFRCAYTLDSVVMVQTAGKIQWHIYGYNASNTPQLMNTYTLTYPTQDADNALLQDIIVNGESVENFSPDERNYNVVATPQMLIQTVKADEAQQVDVTYSDSTYTILVTAVNGAQQTYTVNIVPDLSSDATLLSIALDGTPIDNFDPEQMQYLITLPTQEVKTVEPLMPVVSYTVADANQQVEIQAGSLGETTYLIVTAADKKHYNVYELTVQAEPSHNASLTSILVDGKPVDRFETGRHYYSAWAESQDFLLTWTADDNYQTYTVDTLNSEYTITVTAQDGITQQQYVIDIFTEALPTDATLRQIWINDSLTIAEFEPDLNPKMTFDPNNNRYLIHLPAGTTTMPTVSAQLKMDGQTVDIRSGYRADSIIVTAKDGITHNTYIVEFDVPLSSNTQLDMLYLNGDVFSDFSPATYVYTVALPVGIHTLPNVVAQKAEPMQTVEITTDLQQRQTLVSVRAEDGTTASYVLLFNYTLSENNQLAMIYADNDSLPDFAPDNYNYYISLPVGTRQFPALTYDSVDKWQRIETREVYRTTLQQTTQIEVQAESGKKNIYTIAFTVQQSSADTLQMIYADNLQLPYFNPYITEYSDTLPAGSTILPKIEYEAGDPYQIIRMDTLVDALTMTKSLGQKLHIEVQAENRSTRTYIIHFPIALSTNTQLSMIWNNGQPMSGFNKELLDYDINIPYDETGQRLMPAITVTKAEEAQNVDIQPVGDSILLIRVMAEDALHSDTYRIRFHYGRSPLTTLAGININNLPLDNFDSETTEYHIQAFVDDPLPTVDWLPTVDGQQLLADEPIVTTDDNGIRTGIWSCDVTAPDGDHFRNYTLAIEFSLTAADTASMASALTALYVNGLPVNISNGFDIDFRPDTLNYHFRPYPIGSRNDALFDEKDVTFETADPLAQVHTAVWNKEILTDTFAIEADGTPIFRHVERRIDIIVSDRKGNAPTIYSLHQQVLLSRDSSVAVISFDGTPYLDFDPEIHEYTIAIKAGTTPPLVTFETTDSNAFAADVVADELMYDSLMVWTRTIICYSEYAYAYDRQNVSLRNTYTIRFVESPINESDYPWEGDLLVKALPYSSQVAFASLRSGVQVALYDANGSMLFFRMLQATSPSNAIVAADSYGRTLFTDVSDVSQCMVTTLIPGKIYYYCFYKAGKKRIKTGKLMITR